MVENDNGKRLFPNTRRDRKILERTNLHVNTKLYNAIIEYSKDRLSMLVSILNLHLFFGALSFNVEVSFHFEVRKSKLITMCV